MIKKTVINMTILYYQIVKKICWNEMLKQGSYVTIPKWQTIKFKKGISSLRVSELKNELYGVYFQLSGK